MATKILFRVTGGPLTGKEFVFAQPDLCTVGRSGECSLVLPNDDDNLTVSRRHCLVEIDPPSIRVRDLGSRNGTYVNGKSIGQRPQGVKVDDENLPRMPDVSLREGDTVRVGTTVFQVALVVEEAVVPLVEPGDQHGWPDAPSLSKAAEIKSRGELSHAC
jgi:eukaryotic-like serine/threonine-protein kinase